MTRPTRLVLAVSALALLAAFAVAQASPYVHQPLLPTTTIGGPR